MTTFVDTSGLFALLDADDRRHADASAAWEILGASDAGLLTHNYVLLETCALLQARIGLAAVSALRDALLPMLSVEWVDQELHDLALGALIARGQRAISLVDQISFEVARRAGAQDVFGFDRHFDREGFTLVPG